MGIAIVLLGAIALILLTIMTTGKMFGKRFPKIEKIIFPYLYLSSFVIVISKDVEVGTQERMEMLVILLTFIVIVRCMISFIGKKEKTSHRLIELYVIALMNIGVDIWYNGIVGGINGAGTMYQTIMFLLLVLMIGMRSPLIRLHGRILIAYSLIHGIGFSADVGEDIVTGVTMYVVCVIWIGFVTFVMKKIIKKRLGVQMEKVAPTEGNLALDQIVD